MSQILEKLGRERRAATCGIIIAELLHGAKTSGEEQTFLRMAHSLPFIEADREDWLETGALLLQLRKKGITVPLADALIARLAIKSGCELLAVDVEMNTVDGYAMSSWESGYGDMVMRPDLSTLRLVPWLPGTALVMADLQWHDTSPVAAAPRSILRSQTERLAQRGLAAFIGTELEFIVFDDSYRDAWAAGYRGLRKSSDYNVDYAIHASTRLEPLLRDIRLRMDGAGMY